VFRTFVVKESQLDFTWKKTRAFPRGISLKERHVLLSHGGQLGGLYCCGMFIVRPTVD
jgi:hypothetical protein